MNILKELLSLAQSLDDKGLVSFASRLDSIANTLVMDREDDSVGQIIDLMNASMYSGSSFDKALTNSLMQLYELPEADSEFVANFAKELVDNGLELEDALVIGISEVVGMNSDWASTPSSQELLRRLGLSEDATPLDEINFEDSPFLASQLEMIDDKGLSN